MATAPGYIPNQPGLPKWAFRTEGEWQAYEASQAAIEDPLKGWRPGDEPAEIQSMGPDAYWQANQGDGIGFRPPPGGWWEGGSQTGTPGTGAQTTGSSPWNGGGSPGSTPVPAVSPWSTPVPAVSPWSGPVPAVSPWSGGGTLQVGGGTALTGNSPQARRQRLGYLSRIMSR